MILWQKRHACVSFAHPEQVELAAEVCQSFILDNGAFTLWRAGTGVVDVPAYADWIRDWSRHPGFDWCLIPDVIDGDEAANDRMLGAWFQERGDHGVPVWHLHERLERLKYLGLAYGRVALGSSGEYTEVGTPQWWNRMAEAMDAVCDEEGRPMFRLHGLRMLNPTVFSQLPLASADSTNVARNIGIDQAWKGTYTPRSKTMRALVLADRIEHHASAPRWNRTTRGIQMNFELIG
jgi:hypothetical protein